MNFGYHAARLKGCVQRWWWMKVGRLLESPVRSRSRLVDLHVVAYSCERDWPEMGRALRSFLENVGTPNSFTVVTDGTLTSVSAAYLKRIYPSLVVVRASDYVSKDLPLRLLKRFEGQTIVDRMVMKLGVFMSLPKMGRTLFMDSDIRFFPAALESEWWISDEPRYLLDCQFSGETRLLRSESEKENPVNSGFFILSRPLDWSLPLERLESLGEDYVWFIDQTFLHLAMHSSGGKALEPDRFIMKIDDQFEWGERHVNRETVLRHYVTPVRHKLWVGRGEGGTL